MERARKSSRERNVDRLSALPDGVVCHILSFLTTERSVQTSVLAKRWRTLWAHVPVLDFDYHEYNSSRTIRTRTKSFPGMVCAIMLSHKVQSLNTFSLSYYDGDDDGSKGCYEVGRCIATVVERNVQNLILDLGFELPSCLLTCKTLVSLRMYEDVRIPSTSSAPISLPSLKKLYYTCFKYGVDLTQLLSGCPVLEDLTIYGYLISSCNISSPTLKRLTIVSFVIGIQNHPEYLVNITSPALRYLKLDYCSNKNVSVLTPASLVEAHIFLETSFELDDLHPRCVLKYLDSFCNVKCLHISGRDVEFLDLELAGPYVRFGNLTKLELTADWRLLTKFLQSADQLEVLCFSEICKKSSESWTEPMLDRCACLFHSLKTVTIYGFRCTEQDCNMVSFILRNGLVLQQMAIHCQQLDLKKKFDALQRISLVRRGSRECELLFY